MTGSGSAALVPIQLLGLPVGVYQRASEHTDELLREFALLREDVVGQAPARLLAIVEDLVARFGAFTQGPTQVLQDAAARGQSEIDLEYRVPPAAREAAIELDRLLDESDDFCRAGDLLTLATPPESVAFRRWFLGQFVSQIDGRPATPWSAVMGRTAEG